LEKNFLTGFWNITAIKHDQGVYNTVCLAILLSLPALVLLTSLVICCHCCCISKADAKKKKKTTKDEDLWISVKTEPMASERMTLTVV
uniref:KIAA0040 n=1 Tax=Paramormyrops kingsleyae TaxID=1676925 RepID=A0A3B3QS94_9TELE